MLQKFCVISIGGVSDLPNDNYLYPCQLPPCFVCGHHQVPVISALMAVDGSGGMSRASVSYFGTYGDPDLVGLNPGRVKPMIFKLIPVTS